MASTSEPCTVASRHRKKPRRPRRRREADFPCSLSVEERRLYKHIPEKIDYVAHPLFSSRDAEERLLGPKAKVDVPKWTYFTELADDVSPEAAGRAVLKPEDEATLFLRYNFARYQLSKLIKAQRRRPTGARAQKMVHWYRRALKARSDVVQANMALVLAMAKRTRIPSVEFGELVSEGNMALLRSVEKFDVSRGFKFSTYACRAILKSFNRLATKTGRYRQRFPTEFDPELERSDYDVRKHEMQREDSVEALREILAYNRARLSDVERRIVMERFAIRSRGKARTLAEVGRMVGLTNERVRQIQNLALSKIRTALDEQFLAI